MHVNKLNNKKYIGITKQKPKIRWGYTGSHYDSNTAFYRAIKKYGWDNFEHIILYENLTKEEAEELEVKLILEYKTNNREFGYNISLGKTSTGCKRSAKHKDAIRKAQLGRERTDEQRLQVGEFFKEYFKNNPHPQKDKPPSQETIKKVKQTRIKNGTCNHIYQFDLDGNLIAEYDSALDIKKQTGFDRCNIMKAVKKKGSTKTPYGFIWSMDININLDDYKKIDTKKPVNQYDLDENFINTYPSILNAAKTNNYQDGKIIDVCKGRRKTAYGYKWRYVDKDDLIKNA